MEVRVTRQFLPDLFGRGAGHDVFSNLQREVDPDAAVALSLVLIVVAVIVVGLAHQAGSATSLTRSART